MSGGGGGEECNETYIGETDRSLQARVLEHKRQSSTSSEVCRHINKDKQEHNVHIDEAQILDRHPDWFTRAVQEAIHIRAHKQTQDHYALSLSIIINLFSDKYCQKHSLVLFLLHVLQV